MVIKESQLREMIKKSIVEHLEEGRFTDFMGKAKNFGKKVVKKAGEKIEKIGQEGAKIFDGPLDCKKEKENSLHARVGNSPIDNAIEDFGEPNNGN